MRIISLVIFLQILFLIWIILEAPFSQATLVDPNEGFFKEVPPIQSDEEDWDLATNGFKVELLNEATTPRVTRGLAGSFVIKSPSASQRTEIKPISQHHVLFEPMGQMVGTMSYMHLMVDLKYNRLLEAIQRYNQSLMDAMQELVPPPSSSSSNPGNLMDFIHLLPMDDDNVGKNKGRQEKVSKKISLAKPFLQMIEVEIDGLMHIKERINLLNVLLPPLPKQVSKDRTKREIITLAVAGIIGLLGVTGTFLGAFAQKDIDKLGKQLQNVERRQATLVEVVTQHDQELDQIAQSIGNFSQGLEMLIDNNPGVWHAQFSHKRSLLATRLEQILEAVRIGELHRLASDALHPEDIKAAFELLDQKAKELGMVLVPKQAGHLFQLETSLLRTSETEIALLVHVPIIRKEQIFDLFQYHPIPIVFQNEVTLMVEAEEPILALGPDMTHWTLRLDDLEKCHKFQGLYLCEEQSISKIRPNSTCLGSLYHMHEEGVKAHCPIRSGTGQEVAYQINPSAFIVYTPVPLTALVDCGPANRTHMQLQGHARITLNPGCVGHLAEHRLSVGTSIRVQSEVKYFTWDWNPMLDFVQVTRQEVYQGLLKGNQLNPRGILLHDLLQDLHSGQSEVSMYNYHIWTWVIGLGLSALLAIGFVLGLFYFIRNRRLANEWLVDQLDHHLELHHYQDHQENN